MRYIGIIILLVLCLTLLLLTGCIVNTVIPETTSGNLENQGDTSDTGTVDTGGTVDMEGTGTISNINIDKTPPVVMITLPGTGEYVLNQSITASWSATDALSGVVSPASGTVSIDTSSVGTKTFTLPAGTAKDKAGNSSLKVTISYLVIEEVEVDTTKPVITGSRTPLPNSFGWNNTDVTVSFSCADTGAVQFGIDINTVAGKTLTTEGKDQSVINTGVCTDVAGNTADPVTVSNINIDKTPPVVTITPGTGEYVLNQSITASWSATDALSGVVSPVSGSVSIDTSSVGTKTFILPAGTAKDKAGNSSLKVTISYSVIVDTEEPETENPQKWSGLGMVLFHSQVDSSIDILLANGFTELRLDISDYQNTAWLASSKEHVLVAIAAGARVIWGVSSNAYNNPDYTITATNWSTYRQAILDAALWAQEHGVYEFQLGNEEEFHNDDTTLTDTQLIVNLKSVATDVQAIFTNGNVSYTCAHENIDDWVTAGKDDIDILASNVYKEWNHIVLPWKDEIDALVAAFGTDGTYITEFGPSTSGLDYYSEDEAVQAAAVTEMIDYIKTSGITRAFYFDWKNDEYGVVKNDGTYRLLWNQALLNSESVKFATIPTKITTASLTNTIALIQN